MQLFDDVSISTGDAEADVIFLSPMYTKFDKTSHTFYSRNGTRGNRFGKRIQIHQSTETSIEFTALKSFSLFFSFFSFVIVMFPAFSSLFFSH